MTQIKTYQEAIRIAQNAVEAIDDPQLKIVAFRTILDHLLSAQKQDMGSVSKEFSNLKKHATINSTKLINEAKSLPRNDNKELAMNVYHTTNGDFRVIADLGTDLGKYKQIQYVLLYLYGRYVLTKKPVCLSKTILDNMRRVGFRELPNLNANLRSVPTLILVNTNKNKSDNTYEITQNGIEIAEKLMKEIYMNNGIMENEPVILIKRQKNRKRISLLSKHISELASESFFDLPKTVKETKSRLEEKGFFYERGIIDEKMRRTFLGKILRRIRKDRAWAYIVKH